MKMCTECGEVKPKDNDTEICIPCFGRGQHYRLNTEEEVQAKIKRLKTDGYHEKAQLVQKRLEQAWAKA